MKFKSSPEWTVRIKKGFAWLPVYCEDTNNIVWLGTIYKVQSKHDILWLSKWYFESEYEANIAATNWKIKIAKLGLLK